MHIILSRVAKRIYARISRLSWDAIFVLAACHFAISWGVIALAGGEEIAEGGIFWYFYITSATTVGYGDYSPATWAGRLVTVLWVMPGGIALFTTITRAKITEKHKLPTIGPNSVRLVPLEQTLIDQVGDTPLTIDRFPFFTGRKSAN